MPSVSLYVGARLTDITDVLTSRVVSKKYNQDTGVPYEHVEKTYKLAVKGVAGSHDIGYHAACAAADAVNKAAAANGLATRVSHHQMHDHIGDNHKNPVYSASNWLVGCEVIEGAGSQDYDDTKAYNPDAVTALVSGVRAALQLAFGFDVPVLVVVNGDPSDDDY
jgi:hypothetical protein